jgi:hypothetical protein
MNESPIDQPSPTLPRLSPGYHALETLLAVAGQIENPPQPWTEHPDALVILWRSIVQEIGIRRAIIRPLTLPPFEPPRALRWPSAAPEALRAELDEIRRARAGRIPPPRNVTELWAHHKYSAMARDPRRAREIGSRLGALDPGLDETTLLGELVDLLGRPPRAGPLRDAAMHMWGYVAELARARGIEPDFADIPRLMAKIAEIALEEPASYLAASTALSDLTVWGGGIPDE